MNTLISNILDDILGLSSRYINYDTFIVELSDDLQYVIDILVTIINHPNYPNNVNFKYKKPDDSDLRLNLFNYLGDHEGMDGLITYKFDSINNSKLIDRLASIIVTLERSLSPCGGFYTNNSFNSFNSLRKTVRVSLVENIMIYIEQDDKFHSKHESWIDKKR